MDKKNVQKLKGPIGFPKNTTVVTIIEFYDVDTKIIIFGLLAYIFLFPLELFFLKEVYGNFRK